MLKTRTVLAILSVFILSATACGKKKDKSKDDGVAPTKGAPQKPGGGTVGTGGAALTGMAKAPPSITDALKKLPRDPSLLAAFNFQQMRSSEMYANSPKLFLGLAAKWHERLKKTCGIDMMAEIDLVMVARKADVQYILVDGTITKKAMQACAASSELKATADGPITTYSDPDSDVSLHVSWIGPTQLLAVEKDKAALKALLTRNAVGAGAQPTFDALITKVNTGATAWGFGKVPATFPADMLGLKEAPTMFWGHALYQGNAQIKLGVRFPNDSAASNGKDVIMKMKAAPMGGSADAARLLKSVEVRQRGNDIEAHATLSSDQVKTISTMTGAR